MKSIPPDILEKALDAIMGEIGDCDCEQCRNATRDAIVHHIVAAACAVEERKYGLTIKTISIALGAVHKMVREEQKRDPSLRMSPQFKKDTEDAIRQLNALLPPPPPQPTQ